MINFLRILILVFVTLLSIQCGNKPYQPNYNTSRTHNGDIAGRNRMVQRQCNRDIKAANKARKRASKKRVNRMNKRHEKRSDKKKKKYSKMG